MDREVSRVAPPSPTSASRLFFAGHSTGHPLVHPSKRGRAMEKVCAPRSKGPGEGARATESSILLPPGSDTWFCCSWPLGSHPRAGR